MKAVFIKAFIGRMTKIYNVDGSIIYFIIKINEIIIIIIIII